MKTREDFEFAYYEEKVNSFCRGYMYEAQHGISKMYDNYSSILTLMNNSVWGSNTMLNILILVIQERLCLLRYTN